MSYELQILPDEVAFIDGGGRINPLATLKDEYGGVSHIINDDGCYVLVNGSRGGKFTKVYHWYPEAIDAMKGLPTPPIKGPIEGTIDGDANT